MPHLNIRINPDGTQTITASGFQGNACEKAIAPLIADATVLSQVPTEEAGPALLEQAKVAAGQGGKPT